MKSKKEDYKKIKADAEIAANLEFLKLLLDKKDSLRFEYDKEILDTTKSTFIDWEKKVKKIEKLLIDNHELANYLGIDLDLVINRAKALKEPTEQLKKKRASSTKPIKESIKLLFWRMEDLRYRPIQQQRFIYDIYVENDYDAYIKGSENKSLMDRIEQDQKKAKREYLLHGMGEFKKSLTSSEK